MNVVLTQIADRAKHPIAYFSAQLNKVEQGMPPCYQGLAAATHTYEKASAITIDHKIELYMHHAVICSMH